MRTINIDNSIIVLEPSDKSLDNPLIKSQDWFLLEPVAGSLQVTNCTKSIKINTVNYVLHAKKHSNKLTTKTEKNDMETKKRQI